MSHAQHITMIEVQVMTPSKETLIKTLEGILLSVTNTLANARDNGTDRDSDGVIFEDFIDLQMSRYKLEELINTMRDNVSNQELEC